MEEFQLYKTGKNDNQHKKKNKQFNKGCPPGIP